MVQRAFVRGFFDAEGSVPKGRFSRIEIYQKDRKPLLLIAGILRSLEIYSSRITNSRDVGQLLVRGRRNLARFSELIGSEHPQKKVALTKLF